MYRGKNYLTKTPDGIEVNTPLYLESLEKLPYKDEEELEGAGFSYFWGDNSYNYEDKRRSTQVMQWNLYIRKNPKGRGYNYAVAIWLHNGGDVRGNYSLAGIYKTNEKCFEYLPRLFDGYHMSSRYSINRYRQDIKEFKQNL